MKQAKNDQVRKDAGKHWVSLEQHAVVPNDKASVSAFTDERPGRAALAEVRGVPIPMWKPVDPRPTLVRDVSPHLLVSGTGDSTIMQSRQARESESEPAIHDLSKSCRYYDYGSAETLVWFSGLHEPFLPRRILDDNRINGLFVLDKNFDWYTGGVVGLAETFEQSVDIMRTFLEKHPATLTIGGQSSGGYAALRMAHLVKPALCIAFGPQTQNLHNQPSLHLPPLGPIYSADPPTFPIVLHLARSENDNLHGTWDDWGQIESLMDLNNVTIVRHPYDVHAVSLPLYDQHRFLETVISNMRLYAPPPLSLAKEVSQT